MDVESIQYLVKIKTGNKLEREKTLMDFKIRRHRRVSFAPYTTEIRVIRAERKRQEQMQQMSVQRVPGAVLGTTNGNPKRNTLEIFADHEHLFRSLAPYGMELANMLTNVVPAFKEMEYIRPLAIAPANTEIENNLVKEASVKSYIGDNETTKKMERFFELYYTAYVESKATLESMYADDATLTYKVIQNLNTTFPYRVLNDELVLAAPEEVIAEGAKNIVRYLESFDMTYQKMCSMTVKVGRNGELSAMVSGTLEKKYFNIRSPKGFSTTFTLVMDGEFGLKIKKQAFLVSDLLPLMKMTDMFTPKITSNVAETTVTDITSHLSEMSLGTRRNEDSEQSPSSSAVLSLCSAMQMASLSEDEPANVPTSIATVMEEQLDTQPAGGLDTGSGN